MKKLTLTAALLGTLNLHPAQANTQDAFKFCAAIDRTGMLSKPCDVGVRKINITMDTSSSEARKMCSALAQMASKNGWKLGGWTLNISSPYSNGTIAYCSM